MRRSSFVVITVLLLILAATGLDAQKLTVRMNTGVENTEPLNTIRKLYFSDNNLVVDYYSGNDDVYGIPDIQKLYFDAAVTVEENTGTSDRNLKIYPNPSQDILIISGLPANAGSLSVYSSDGGLVLTIKVTSEREKINVSHFNNGLYLINASGYSAKFIKQ